MNLKMYEFEGGSITWVCAENKEQAINIFKAYYGKDVWEEGLEIYGDDAIREMDSNEIFTYYEDGKKPDEDTIENHINRRCDGPDIFATSMY